MGILDDAPNEISIPDKIANSLKFNAKQLYKTMVSAFNNGTRNFWTNPLATPEEIAASLGNDAKEIFELHYKLGQLLSTIKPEDINDSLSSIGQFTMNQDGTVTIINN